MKKLPGQSRIDDSGAIHTLPLFLIIAAVGIISYLLISSTAPFKGGMFGVVNPKPASQAMDMSMMDQCVYLNPDGTQNMSINSAFCDTFATPMPGGRGGDLDETKWEYARVNEGNNPSQDALQDFDPGPAQHCKTVIQGVLPDNDSFICGAEFGEPNHWMETFNDQGGYVFDSAKVRQPFDFNNRTGTITFNVDAKSNDSHTWWPEVWITDQPVGGAHHTAQTDNVPRNGVGFEINAGAVSCLPAAFINDISDYTTVSKNTIGGADFVYNFHQFSGSGQSQPNNCFTTQADNPNHFEIKISKTRIEVWASDIGGANFRQIMVFTQMPDPNSSDPLHPSLIPLNLPFTRGFVSFGHADYNGCKAGPPCIQSQTYHWHGLGFDGPVLPMLQGHDVPDPMTPARNPGSVMLGFYVNGQGAIHHACCNNDMAPQVFNLPNVDLNGMGEAHLNFTYQCFDGAGIDYRFNGGTWRTVQPNPSFWSQSSSTGCATPQSALAPVLLSDLKQGTNTLEYRYLGSGFGPVIANIGLELTPNAIVPTPTASPTPSPVPLSTPQPGNNSFTGEYWNMVNGKIVPGWVPAVVVRNDPVINFNWNGASPAPGINGTQFVVRWNGNFNFAQAGTYTFTTNVDDGVRLFIDGNKVIDRWTDEAPTTYTANVPLTAGTHTVRMEYYQAAGGDQASLVWALAGSATPSPTPTPLPSASGTCPKAAQGDIDCDGTIGIFDFNSLVTNFNKTGTGVAGDIDGSGKVDIFDFNTLVTNFGH